MPVRRIGAKVENMNNVTESAVEPVGRVRRVAGQVVAVECTSAYRPALGELLTGSEDQSIRLEAYAYRGEGLLYCLLLSAPSGISRKTEIVSTGAPISIPVGPGLLGRAINLYGEPMDGGLALVEEARRSIAASRTSRTSLVGAGAIIDTGLKCVDFFAPIREGARTALVGGAGVGKTVMQTEILRHFLSRSTKSVAVFAGIGERVREGHALWELLKEQDVLKDTSLIFGYNNKNAGIRFRSAAAAAALVEYFRDEEGKDVIFFIDNVFRFLQAGAELATLLGEIPSEFGYQPTLQSEISSFENRLSSTKEGSVTSIQTLYVPSDEFENPAVAAALAHMETVIVFSREMASRNWRPALDPLRSSSQALRPDIVGEAHYKAVTAASAVLNQYDRLERIVSIVGEEELSEENRKTFRRAERLRHYMTQPLLTTSIEDGKPGASVARSDTVRDVEAILAGRVDDVPSERLLYISDLKSAGFLR